VLFDSLPLGGYDCADVLFAGMATQSQQIDKLVDTDNDAGEYQNVC
jgi:hypothetical protein